MTATTRTTGLEALEAARAAFRYLRGEGATADSHEVRQTIDLMMDLAPYSSAFRIQLGGTRLRGTGDFRSVTIYGDDEGCVNNDPRRPLASCWLDENGRFYYEA